MALKRILKARPDLDDNLMFTTLPIPLEHRAIIRNCTETTKQELAKVINLRDGSCPEIFIMSYHPEVPMLNKLFTRFYPRSYLVAEFKQRLKTLKLYNDLHNLHRED